MSYRFGGQLFRTKAQVQEAVRAVLNSGDLGSTLNADEHELVLDVLMRHPERDAKRIASTVRIERRAGRYQKDRCFWIVRNDGTSSDVSYIKAMANLNAGPGRDTTPLVMQMLRSEVRDQVEAFLAQQSFPIVCPFSLKSVSRGDAHVDHWWPQTFKSLVFEWLESEDLDIADVPISPPRDGQLGRHCPDRALIGRWQVFHEWNARLRVISAEWNQRLRDADPLTNEVLHDRLSVLTMLAETVLGSADTRATLRPVLLALIEPLLKARDEHIEWLHKGDAWFRRNPNHPQFQEFEQRWIARLAAYRDVDNTLELLLRSSREFLEEAA